jgi:hypothetical protein
MFGALADDPMYEEEGDMTSDVLDRMRAQIGDPMKALERKKRMDESVRFALEHLEQWREEHPNNWVAVYDHRLVAAEPSRERLIEAVEKSGVALDEVYVDFITEEKSLFVL